QIRLRDLASRTGIDVNRPYTLGQALDQAMLLGSADILLDELLTLLTPAQRETLYQVAVCRAPMRMNDLTAALTTNGASPALDPDQIRADVERLADLTLLDPHPLALPPGPADRGTRHAPTDLHDQHNRALTMHLRRFETGAGTYEDLLDLARHLAALGRYDEVADLAAQGTQV